MKNQPLPVLRNGALSTIAKEQYAAAYCSSLIYPLLPVSGSRAICISPYPTPRNGAWGFCPASPRIVSGRGFFLLLRIEYLHIIQPQARKSALLADPWTTLNSGTAIDADAVFAVPDFKGIIWLILIGWRMTEDQDITIRNGIIQRPSRPHSTFEWRDILLFMILIAIAKRSTMYELISDARNLNIPFCG